MKIVRPVILLLLTISLLIGDTFFGTFKFPATAIPLTHADTSHDIFIICDSLTGTGSEIRQFSESAIENFNSLFLPILEPGEKLTAIESGLSGLIGVSNLGNFFAIDPINGRVEKMAKTTSALTNPNIGFDIDPFLKEARSVANELNENAVFDAETGELKDIHNKLKYEAGGVNENRIPRLNGIAYMTNADSTTTLYGIDSELGVLVRIDNPFLGVLVILGSLGVETTENVGFDISEDGKAFASLTDPANPNVSKLYSINLETGRATELGTIRSSGPVIGLTVGEEIEGGPQPASACLIDPAEARVSAGGRHFFTVKFTGDFSLLANGVFGIISGPNAGNLSVSDNDGEILVDYKGTEPGTDVIEFSGTPPGGPPFSCRATVEWVINGPVIESVRITGKDLRIVGSNFLPGTEVNLNGIDQKIKIKSSRVIIVKKASRHLKQCVGGTSLPNRVRVLRREVNFSPVVDTAAFATCP
jgi:hypothetical protein